MADGQGSGLSRTLAISDVTVLIGCWGQDRLLQESPRPMSGRAVMCEAPWTALVGRRRSTRAPVAPPLPRGGRCASARGGGERAFGFTMIVECHLVDDACAGGRDNVRGARRNLAAFQALSIAARMTA